MGEVEFTFSIEVKLSHFLCGVKNIAE